MLTGMIETTEGKATINNLDINSSMTEIRQFISVCPQSSILWPMLTVSEHLMFFQKLKNAHNSDNIIDNNSDNINNAMNDILTNLQLIDKKDSFSSTLSGGQKRKLSLAIAFVGQPKLIILDEPSTGLDPCAKRDLWKIIENNKKNKCIVVTTHDMYVFVLFFASACVVRGVI